MTRVSARGSCRSPISNFLVLTYLISSFSHADALFPDLPSRSFPAIQVLPSKGEIILEIRSTLHHAICVGGEKPATAARCS